MRVATESSFGVEGRACVAVDVGAGGSGSNLTEVGGGGQLGDSDSVGVGLIIEIHHIYV